MRDVFGHVWHGALFLLLIGVGLFARRFDRRRAIRRAEKRSASPGSPDRILAGAIEKVSREVANRVTILETKIERRADGGPCDGNPQLFAFFIVDENAERQAPGRDGLTAQINEALRRELLLSGYFRLSHETLHVLVMSLKTYESPWWR
jgi:hypothetical protein